MKEMRSFFDFHAKCQEMNRQIHLTTVYIKSIVYIYNIYTYELGKAMNIIISNSSDKPIYEQIYMQIKGQIMNGELKEGELLPSIRVLAKELRVSVITTKRAYEELERDGFIEVVQGKGTFVARRNLDFIREEQLKLIEEMMQKSVDIAKTSNVSLEELVELITLIYKGE